MSIKAKDLIKMLQMLPNDEVEIVSFNDGVMLYKETLPKVNGVYIANASDLTIQNNDDNS